MNYYPFHIGDFRSGTFNLCRKSRWIYRDMLDVYYDTEQPLTLDFELLCDQLGIFNDDERRVAEKLLRLKFVKTENGYQNAACDKVIDAYRVKACSAKENGRLGGRPKKPRENPDETQSVILGSDQVNLANPAETGSKANQEPITNNQTIPPNPQGGLSGSSRKKPRMQLKTYIEHCIAENKKPISDYQPLIEYLDKTGLPANFVQLAWDQFKRQFMPGGKDESRMQADWKRHFLNYVEKNYMRLWYAKQGEHGIDYLLTTQGIQAEALMKGEKN